MELDLNKIFYKWIDYKTLELDKANFYKLDNLCFVDAIFIWKKTFAPNSYNCIKTPTFYIIKTRECWNNSGMNIYSIYLHNYRKVGQIKQFKKSDIAHKNVLEMRGLACHYYWDKTQEILCILWISQEWNMRTLHIDYCMDVVDYSVEDIVSELNRKLYKDIKPHITYWKETSISIDIWECRIRVYDKIKEIVETKKDQEYKEYIKLNRNVTRIEVAYKSTRQWSNRTYGAIIKRIEGIFCDTIEQKLNIKNLWASIKKKIWVVIEEAEKIVIDGLNVINSQVEEVREKLKFNIKRAKKTLENIQYLLGCDTYSQLKKDYKYCEYDSITEDIEELLGVIYS